MPRLSITLPKDLYDKVADISGDNDESMSYTIAKMTELGLLVTENQKKNKVKSLSDIEEHSYKLMIQMNAIIKHIAAKQLDFNKDDFDKLRDAAILKYNELIGIEVEEL
jgi:hypothetical protein